MNNTCIGCGDELAAISDLESPAGRRDVCDDDRCRELARLRHQLDLAKISNLQQSTSLAAVRAILRDLEDPESRVPAELDSLATPLCDRIDELVEFMDERRAYLTLLAIARHAHAGLTRAREEWEAAA